MADNTCLEGQWSENALRPLREAKDLNGLWSAIQEFAINIGERKDYGGEGIADLFKDFLAEISRRAGLGMEVWDGCEGMDCSYPAPEEY